MSPALPTIAEALARVSRRLELAGIPGSRLDAEVLLADLLRVERAYLFAHGDRVLNGEQYARLTARVERRCRWEPVAYITGVREFWSIAFEVTPAVLIPRPETERLIEVALERCHHLETGLVADIGTGSGAIVAALATELPDTRFVATDVSPDAIELARRNLARLGLDDRVELRLGDLFQPLAADRALAAIVSNPPYIRAGDVPRLPPDVRDYEPLHALVGGPDGLDVIRRLVAGAPDHLAPAGWLVVEIGAEQGDAVRALLTRAGFEEIGIASDLAGRDRVVAGVWPGRP